MNKNLLKKAYFFTFDTVNFFCINISRYNKQSQHIKKEYNDIITCYRI